MKFHRFTSHNQPVALILVAGLIPLHAQNMLDPLVVTAERIATALSETPYATTSLDAPYIRENTRRTLPDALQYTPGVLVQKTAYGQGSPFIRGFTGRQNLLLVDGVRVNNSTFRSGPVQYWNTIDSLAIDHLELIKSQGSVLYGSDAIGGTLNVFGKSSKFRDNTADQPYISGAASYEYRSNGQGSHIGRLETDTGIGGNFGILLGLSAKNFGDIQDSAVGRMHNTGYPEQNLDCRIDWALTTDSTLTLAHYTVNQDDISRWHRTIYNPGWSEDGHVAVPGKWAADTFNQAHTLTYLRYAGQNPLTNAAIQRWNATLSYQTVGDSEYQNRIGDPAAGSRPIRDSSIDTYTLGVDLMLESRLGPGSLVYGLDYYHDKVNSSGYQTNLSDSNRRESLPIGDDSNYDLLGMYGQYVWKPQEPVEITGGARYTYTRASVGRFYNSNNVIQPGQNQDWNSLVGSLRGLYHINPNWALYGGISQAFRAPNLDDLSGNATARAGNDSLGSATLNPEKFITYEVGVRQHTENLSITTAAFYTDARDLIIGVPISDGSSTTVATNASNGYVYGFELEGAWHIDAQWTLSGFAAWQDGHTNIPAYIDGPVQNRPNTRNLPLTGSLALRWTTMAKNYWMEGRVQAAGTESRISAADQAADNQRIPTGGTPGYVVASLHAGWQVNEHLDLNCGLENLTNTSYRIHGSGQNEPGFNAIVGARVTW
ncbi:MAG: TonB-dependent receptor [Verrucomicrobiota bacterium]